MQLQDKKPSRPNPPGRPPPGKALTPAAVAEAAERLIDSEGLEAFSMRRLGQALGVEAMALYNHFEDKEAILDAVASLALARVPAPPAKGSWRSRLKGLALGVRGMACEHPRLFRLAMTRRTPPTAALPQTESVLTALAEAGLNPEEQATAFQTLFLYVRAFCLWEIEELDRERERERFHLPEIAGDYPRTAAARQYVLAPGPERLFEQGLEMLLRGLSRRKGRRR